MEVWAGPGQKNKNMWAAGVNWLEIKGNGLSFWAERNKGSKHWSLNGFKGKGVSL